MLDMELGGENNTQVLMEQLAEAFHELEAIKETFDCKIEWVEIKQHFHDLEVTLKKKLEEFEAKEREYEEKESETHKLLAERQAAVASKEQDLLDRVQELKDAAVAAIAEAYSDHRSVTLEYVDDVESKDNKVSGSHGDANSPEEDFPHKSSENSEGMAIEFRPRPELTHFCKQMDAKSLLTYIVENENNLSVIREEMSVALESATEPARLVLDSLEGFYPTNDSAKQVKMDAALQGMRKSCIIIVEALANLLASADSGADHLLNPEFKQQAKAIADEWRRELASADIDAANGNSLEAEAYLQLLSTFRIASEFDGEELCKLVIAVAQCKQAPELCRSIGLTHKVPAIVDLLINDGKQIAAVHFIHAFRLEESLPTVPLLKEYLKNIRRNSQVKAGNADDVCHANARELAALKSVINCIKEYKLESDYPLDPLLKRVGQLERSKGADKKRNGDFNKQWHQSKKPRTSAGYFSSPSSSGRDASRGIIGRQLPPVRAAYSGIPNRYPGQAIHTRPSHAALSNQGRYMGSSLQSSDRLYL